jgi:hypothetical protein
MFPHEMLDININAEVYLELTDYGKEIFLKHYKDLNIDEKYIPEYEGIIKMSIWNMSKIFGECLYMGNTKIPFVNNKISLPIKIENSKVKPII